MNHLASLADVEQQQQPPGSSHGHTPPSSTALSLSSASPLQPVPPTSTPDSSMAGLLDQAPEILHNIFSCVDPEDLATLARTCHYLNTIIKNDELLWKLHYLSRFDNLLRDEDESWRFRTTRLVNLQKLLESDDESIKQRSLETILTQTIDLASNSPATSTKVPDFLANLYAKPVNVDALLCRSTIFGRARPRNWTAAGSEELRQLSAHLHVLAGMSLEPAWAAPDEVACPHIIRAHLRAVFDEDENDDDDENDSDYETEDESPPDSEGRSSSQRSSNSPNPQPIRQVHPYARSRIYDLRRYNANNMWGPFTDDGEQRVDWEKVQAIMIVLAFNHRMHVERRGFNAMDFLPPIILEASTSPGMTAAPPSSSTAAATSAPSSSTQPGVTGVTGVAPSVLQPWDGPFLGLAAGSYKPYSLAGKIIRAPHPDLDALDPYGVTGTWMRIVCFLDYNDLYAFNFESTPLPPDQERGPITTREAFRLIRLQLHVTEIEPVEGDLPVVHFEGASRSTFMAWDPNANSRIRGTVRKTPTGAIRWTTFSIFHGEERWRSEGVQIGGLRSARGILGNWFDKDYDAHGPAGPTAFWKISDEMVEERRPVPHNMMHIFMAE